MAINVTINVSPAQRTHDAGWDESKHKRDHGKFASGSGGSGGGSKPLSKAEPDRDLTRKQAYHGKAAGFYPSGKGYHMRAGASPKTVHAAMEKAGWTKKSQEKKGDALHVKWHHPKVGEATTEHHTSSFTTPGGLKRGGPNSGQPRPAIKNVEHLSKFYLS